MKDVLQKFIDTTVLKISRDPRFCGVAVGGSWLTGEIDDFSDLDLVIVSCDETFNHILDERIEIAKALGSHVSSFTGEHVGEPRLLICLFKDPLIHVDLKFVALKDFHKRIENPFIAWQSDEKLTKALLQSDPRILKPDPQWIEDRFWTWIHYAASKIGRGELFEAIGFLSFLREKVLCPLAMWIHEKPVRGARKIEKHLPDFATRLQRTVPAYSLKSCFEALRAAAEIYRELRSHVQYLKLNTEAEIEVLDYVAKISCEIGKD